MDPFLKENLITTKDASELSGYTSDYLARLARSGKIVGKRIGHSWFIERESLTHFLGQQGDRKIDHARALARAREVEYRAHRSLLGRTTKSLTKPIQIPQFGIGHIGHPMSDINTGKSSLRSQVFALSVAGIVVFSSALAAQAAVIPQIADVAASIARSVASGFDATFGAIPAHVAEHISAADTVARAQSARVASQSLRASADIAMPLLAKLDFSSVQLPFSENSFATRQREGPAAMASANVATNTPALSVENVKSFARDAYANLSSPSLITRALARGYVALGDDAYSAIAASLAAYRSLIETAGANTLALAATTRDMLAGAPQAVNRVNLAFGQSIISATHFAIRADVSLAYGTAAAAPATARATVAFIGSAGDLLAGATARVPALAAGLYLRATAAPAELAPAVAQAVFNAEYAGAVRFASAAHTTAATYLALVENTGAVAYSGTTGAVALAHTAAPLFTHTRATLEDAYLGALGTSALALDRLARGPGIAAVLVAAHPALSVTQQIALGTYETIHAIMSSTTNTLATLFMPFIQTPPVVLPNGTVAKSHFVIASTSPAFATTRNSYTTLVQGVSSEFVQQTLAIQRGNILATVAGMIQPVAAQGVTNMTTIQQVNMIQDLSNLIVRNGDFRGSTFSGGNVSGAVSVSATTGSFGTLSASTANIGTTTVTGDLTVTGTITPGVVAAGNSVSAPYFIASATNATSTFAGSLNVDNGGLVYATSTKNVGIGILSPAALLAIKNSTSTQPIFVAQNDLGSEMFRITNAGFVGIGTSSPTYALAVEGSSSLGNQAIAGYFTATSSTATSTFAGSLAVGTSSPWGNGLFTVGTSSPLIYVSNTGGRIGIGTSTPASILDIYGTDALHLPVGTSAQRPGMALIGQVRFNTDTHQFEGYNDSGVWQGIGGVINPALSTKITAGTDDYLRFFTSSAERMTIGNTGNIGVGTTSPFAHFSLAGTAGGTQNLLAVSTSTAGFATTTALTINQNGDLALLNGANLTVGGNLTVTGATTFSNAITGPITSTGTSTATYFAASQRGFAGAPAFTFSGDLTTGLWSPLASMLAISTGGVERVRVDSSGNVGIGTTSPQSRLAVSGGLSVGADYNIAAPTNGAIIEGNVGIGTTNPGNKLSVQGGFNLSSDGTNNVTFTNNGATGAGNAALLIQTGTGNFEIDKAGNVGIGTTSPYAQLSIATPNGSTGSLSTLFTISSSTQAGATTTLMTVLANGNVGIGTSSPTYALGVNGSIQTAPGGELYFGTNKPSVQDPTNYPGIWIGNSNSSIMGETTVGYKGLLFNANVARSGGTWVQIDNSKSSWQSYMDYDSTVDAFGIIRSAAGIAPASGQQMFIIKGSGNVGIGTTSPQSRLAVSGGASIGADYNTAAPSNGAIIEGNVGIGTTTPGALLAVQGNGLFAGTLTANNITATGTMSFGTTTITNLAVTNTSSSTFAGPVSIGTTGSAAGELYVVNKSYVNYPLIVENEAGPYGFGSVHSGNVLQIAKVGGGLTNFTIDSSDNSDTILGFNGAGGRGTLTAKGDYNWYLDTNSGFGTGHLYLNDTSTGNVLMANGGGKVGVNTSAPYSKLQVTGSGTGTGQTFAVVNSASTTLMQVLDNGNVGIGMTTPIDKLQVYGNLKVSGYDGGSGVISFGDAAAAATSTSAGVYIGRQLDLFSGVTALSLGGFGGFAFHTGDTAGATTTPKMVIMQNGNVGIGTTNPQAKLDVQGIASSTAFYANNGTVSAPGYSFSSATNAGLYWDGTFVNVAVGGLRVAYIGATDASLPALTLAGASRIVNSSDGVIKISNNAGTDFNRLQFGGTTASFPAIHSINTSTGAQNALQVIAADGSGNTNLLVTGNVGIGTTSPQSRLAVSGGLSVGADYNIAAPTNGAIIEGNVGIGTTNPTDLFSVQSPSTISSGFNDIAQFLAPSQGGGSKVSVNFGIAGSTNNLGKTVFNYVGSGSTSNYVGIGFFNNDNLLNVQASGNVGIGTTSPQSRLAVSGGLSVGADYNIAAPTNGAII
ncbi:hypothetical protein KGQ72_01905, partial [Patescibacteria group bacterium]|nr:hypothetical protein [Patescibacteria group bacterium]